MNSLDPQSTEPTGAHNPFARQIITESHGAAPSAEHLAMEMRLSGPMARALGRIPERQRAALLMAEVNDLTGDVADTSRSEVMEVVVILLISYEVVAAILKH